MNKWMKKLTAALCAAVLMCGMAVTAYAGGGEEWDGLDPVEPPPMETVDPGEGFTEDGNLVTRDLLYDKATNKQFITVQTSGGNTFYIVIDYDKPTDEDGEQYQTYFLNIVDEADLLAAMQAAGGELPLGGRGRNGKRGRGMRFTNSPYEDFMKEKSYFKGAPPNLPPKGSRCDGCPYWHGIGCVFCYREQLKPKTGGKHEP